MENITTLSGPISPTSWTSEPVRKRAASDAGLSNDGRAAQRRRIASHPVSSSSPPLSGTIVEALSSINSVLQSLNTKVLRIEEDILRSNLMQGKFKFDKGWMLCGQGKYAEAEFKFKRAIAIYQAAGANHRCLRDAQKGLEMASEGLRE